MDRFDEIQCEINELNFRLRAKFDEIEADMNPNLQNHFRYKHELAVIQNKIMLLVTERNMLRLAKRNTTQEN